MQLYAAAAYCWGQLGLLKLPSKVVRAPSTSSGASELTVVLVVPISTDEDEGERSKWWER